MTAAGRILVADDDYLFRKAVVRLLEREGYVVEQAEDATGALALLSTRVFELLVADVNMPGNRNRNRNGDGIGDRALAVLCDQDVVPVLIVTGEPTVDSAVAALRGAAVDYLTKPLVPERFLARVAAGVARAHALRQLGATQERLHEQLELVASLRASLAKLGVSLGGPLNPAQVQAQADELPSPIAALLSPREREVLAAFRVSPKIAEVAEHLHISPHTVKNHIKAIFRKLEVSSQAELLARVDQVARGEV